MTVDVSPYSTVKWLIGSGEEPRWVKDELDKERIASYLKYEQIYWSDVSAFRLMRRGVETKPIYIPNGKTICDSTAHYWMKGLVIGPEDKDGDPALSKALSAFFRREAFYSGFHTAKHSGVVRGDFIYHMTADPRKATTKRISLKSIDPAAYFPIHDDDDLDNIIGVNLIEPFQDGDGKIRIKQLEYRYEEGGRVSSFEAVYENDLNWGSNIPTLTRIISDFQILPEGIDVIPVYQFKNVDWQGQIFGSSELRGFERIMGAVNQSISDEELALALDGLGVYATDAGSPVDKAGNEIPWEIGPGRVMEVPSGSYFRRVEGLGTVQPQQDHLKYLGDHLMESSATFRGGFVEVQAAESGIALAIRFLPTIAKLEQRDLSGVDKLNQLFHDWTVWYKVFEGEDYTKTDIVATLGDKLPMNRDKRVTELNNMFDRKIISAAYYRQEMAVLGYTFPDNIDDEIIEEIQKLQEAGVTGYDSPGTTLAPVTPTGAPAAGGDPNQPNAGSLPKPPPQNTNGKKVNESGGTEAKQTPVQQQKSSTRR